jgi:hypothetical protein
MCDLFSQQDIPSIRVQILNDLVFCKHNSADINVVKNYGGLVSFCFRLIVFYVSLLFIKVLFSLFMLLLYFFFLQGGSRV